MIPYLQKQIDKIHTLPKSISDKILKEYELMNELGIDNEEDQSQCFYFITYVPQVIRIIYNKELPKQVIKSIILDVFSNRKQTPISSLLDLMHATHLSIKNLIPIEMRPKIAYPNQDKDDLQLPTYNVDAWVVTTKKIYELIQKGYSESQAIKEVTKNFDERESMNYKTWLSNYQDHVPDKYKIASIYESPTTPGYFVPSDSKEIQKKYLPNMPSVPNLPGKPQDDVHSARDKIEAQRSKLISRLNSAEKLLYTMDGQFFAGEDQEIMLKLLQDLKRKIQTSNKITIKSTLFQDLIYRTGNKLKIAGKDVHADFFYKIAQDSAPVDPLAGPMPGSEPMLGGSAPDPLAGPSTDPSASPFGSPAPTSSGDAEQTKKMLKEFFDALKSQGVPNSPIKEKIEEEKVNEEKKASYENDDEIVIFAQDVAIPAPAPIPTPPVAKPIPVPKPIPIPESEQDIIKVDDTEEGVMEGADKPDDKTDDVIDAALSNISANDVIERLEMLLGIYNQREISRQLSILDIMMDKLGFAAFFPQLGEAMNKALESNQYIATRLADVLSKLKGSIKTPSTDSWVDNTEPTSAENMQIQQNLIEQENKEEERRELRKQREIAKETKPKSVVVEPDLQQPARLEAPPQPVATR